MSGVPARRSPVWIVALLWLFIAFAAWFGEHSAMPPPVRVADPQDREFSAPRALETLRQIALRPRPTGTPENARVRDVLVDALRALGLQVEVQRELVVHRYGRDPAAIVARVENIIGVLPGTEPGKDLLLMAHYDSVPSGPGAGDDGSGVVTILETLRHLARDPERRNDVVVLFSDGEEIGLLGAQAFFERHSRAKEIAQTLNFEARGSRGPVLMFETSSGNGALIEAMAATVARPIANSLTYGVYQQMSNDTDLSIVKGVGSPAMNFAFGHGLFDYHSATDTPDRLSLETLQHQGDYALPLARHFANVELPVAAQADLHYFNPLGAWFVHYPAWLDLAVLIAAAGLIGFALVRARRAGALSIGGVLRGWVLALIALALPVGFILVTQPVLIPDLDAIATGFGVAARARWWMLGWSLLGVGIAGWLLARAQHGYGWFVAIGLAVPLAVLAFAGGQPWIYVLAISVLILVLSGWVLRAPIMPEALVAGALLVWLLLAGLAVWGLGGAVHVFAWPLLAIAALHAWRWRGDGRVAVPWYFVAGVPAAVIIGSYALLIDVMLGTSMPFVGVLLLLLVLLLLAPVAILDRRGLVASTSCVIGVAVLLFCAMRDPFGAQFPRPTELFLLSDADAGSSYWVSSDPILTPWQQQVLGTDPKVITEIDHLPGTETRVRGVSVEIPPAARPVLELLDDQVDSNGRHLRLSLRVEGGSDYLSVFLPPATALNAWRLDGQALPMPARAAEQWWRLRAYGLATDSVTLELDLAAGSELPTVQLTSIQYRLPTSAVLPARPPELMRAPYTYSDATVVSRRLRLQATPAG